MTIQFPDVDEPIRILQITSPTLREGKSTIVANLGLALAQTGQRIVIVCCDLRRPRIHRFFSLDNESGLTSVIGRTSGLRQVIRDIEDQPWLRVIISGPEPPNPTELLSSRRGPDILTTLRDQSDIVLLDCPPVLPVADSLALSAAADATLLVCRAGSTTRKDLTRAVELLRQVGAPLAGTILNAMDAHAI